MIYFLIINGNPANMRVLYSLLNPPSRRGLAVIGIGRRKLLVELARLSVEVVSKPSSPER